MAVAEMEDAVTLANRIGVQDEVECPDCGEPIEAAEDVIGVVFRCENLECMSVFDAEELFPDAYPERKCAAVLDAGGPDQELKLLRAENKLLRDTIASLLASND